MVGTTRRALRVRSFLLRGVYARCSQRALEPVGQRFMMHEEEAADVLGFFDDVQQWALSPVAYTMGTDFKPATRPDVETVISWNSWSG